MNISQYNTIINTLFVQLSKHHITQIKIQQGICVSKHLIMCTTLVENVQLSNINQRNAHFSN